MRFAIALMLLLSTVSAQEIVKYIPEDAEWTYWDENSWPGQDWYMPGFDDSEWKSGRAYFGTEKEVRGDGLKTILDMGKHAHPTYYFRHRFQIEDISAIESLKFNIDYDDAYAVYLNGEIIGASNYGCSWKNHEYDKCKPYPHNSLIDDPKSVSEPIFPTVELSQERIGLLERGENVIAVAIKQGARTSSDAAFMMTLDGGKKEDLTSFKTRYSISIIVAIAIFVLALRRRRIKQAGPKEKDEAFEVIVLKE